MRHPRIPPVLVPIIISCPAFAAPPQEATPATPAPPAVSPEVTTTSHRVRIAGREIEYTATAGTLSLATEEGEERARVFHVAYVRSDVEDPSERPVTFTFNGGPGSSSVWLHLGAFGPRRVVMDDEGFPLEPPGRLVDNEYCLLDRSDFVFIDPVTTGYSRSAEGVDDSEFHGVTQDVEAVGEFIRLWVTQNGRWDSPKFLCGESYGTTRAAALSGFLQDRHGMYLNGIVLVSSILQMQTARFDTGNDLPYLLFLPTYTATAWFHGRLDEELSGDLHATLAKVEEFALGEYALALLKGNRITGAEREAIAAKLARYTGLSKDYVLDANLRIQIGRFTKELRRDEGLTVGRLDSRFTGEDRDSAGENYEFDPSYAAIQGPYTSALNRYVREELGYESDLTYEILTGRVRPWRYPVENEYLNVAETLRQEMSRNQNLRIYVACGYYDLATPYFAARYTFDHMTLDEPTDPKRVTFGYFDAGHMMYIRQRDLVRLRDELVAFYDGVLAH